MILSMPSLLGLLFLVEFEKGIGLLLMGYVITHNIYCVSMVNISVCIYFSDAHLVIKCVQWWCNGFRSEAQVLTTCRLDARSGEDVIEVKRDNKIVTWLWQRLFTMYGLQETTLYGRMLFHDLVKWLELSNMLYVGVLDPRWMKSGLMRIKLGCKTYNL